ncbi:YncE family protein, partial [Streptomyces sp. NPDC058572]|uniref:YncE family protein n=1 Tax=Streptomyces sp. NPDC058572 TaxID=3346546 RepID=UPI003656440F
VIDTVPLLPTGGDNPIGVAVSPAGTRLYIANSAGDDSVSVIDTTLVPPAVIDTVPLGTDPVDVAVSPDGTRAYTANNAADNVSVIDTATNTVIDTVPLGGFGVGDGPNHVAVSPDGTRAYTGNFVSDNVSVIDTLTNTRVPPVTVAPTGDGPTAVAVAAVPGTATAQCPPGTALTGGGFEITGPFPNYFNSKPVINDTWQIS